MSFPGPAEPRDIALTFDDAPRGDGRLFTGEERTRRLIEALEAVDVTGAAFFAVGRHVEERGTNRLAAYAQAGHFIANHSQTHQAPERLGLEGYLADVARAHEVLSGLDGFLPLYRFPFLNEGRDLAMRDGLRAGLEALDYEQAYVTVDNYDWAMEALFQRALGEGREIDFEVLGERYVSLLLDAVAFYDAIAVDVLGRSPRHVLLLHENDLAALYVDDLVRALRERGWTVISTPDAYEDPIAEDLPDTLFLGQGRVSAMAAVAGRERASLVHEAEDQAWLERHFEDAGVFGPAPDWSPFDAELLYSDNRDGVTRIMRRGGAREEPRTLTPGSSGGNFPVWSPDGTRIAFQRRDVDGQLDVWLMEAEGENPRRLTSDPAHDYLPSFRPGTGEVHFLSWRGAPGESSPASRHYLQSPAGSPARPFIDESPGTSAGIAWSPGGDFAVLTRSTGEQAADLFLADGQGQVLRRLTEDDRYNGSPSVAPDGRRVAFYSQGETHSRIEVLDLETARREVLVAEGLNWAPTWSPDGRWLLFSRSVTPDHADTDLYVIPASPGERPRVLLSGPGRQAEASWRRP